MNSAEAAQNSEIWGDLFSVGRKIFDAPDIESSRFYFQRLKTSTFTRPSFYIKLVTARNRSKNIATRWADLDILVQYHTVSEWDAITVGDKLMGLFSGYPEVLLHRYDFTTSPPTKVSITGVDEYGEAVDMAMGIRIDPESVKMSTVETPDQKWQTSVEFSMVSPRRASMDLAPFLSLASWEMINYELNLPTEVSIHTHAALTVTVI